MLYRVGHFYVKHVLNSVIYATDLVLTYGFLKRTLIFYIINVHLFIIENNAISIYRQNQKLLVKFNLSYRKDL